LSYRADCDELRRRATNRRIAGATGGAAARRPAPRWVTLAATHEEHDMPKGEQRSNKMVKKPKKDNSPPKDNSGLSGRPVPPVTSVMPKGKLKNKQ
jgi:hypothetical protein